MRTFGTTSRDLAAPREWLPELGVTRAGMEGIGVYWQRPSMRRWRTPSGSSSANASHMRNVPGRKTDVKDAEWIADLVRHGSVRASFVPPPDVRALRDLVRHRKALAGVLAAGRNRTLKLPESADIKLAGAMSDVSGVSGMAMLRALAEGTATPAEMAGLAGRRLRRKIGALALASEGRLAEHQRLLLRMHIRRLEEIGRDLAAKLEAAIADARRRSREQEALLTQIPGLDAPTAAGIIAESGADTAVFGTARRLATWAGVRPANHESAGEQKPGRTREGNTHLKATPMTAAISASQTKGTHPRDKFHRPKARMGTKKAAMAVAHKILIAAFHMLSRAVPFVELGADYLDRRNRHQTAERLLRRLNALGYEVTLRPRAAD